MMGELCGVEDEGVVEEEEEGGMWRKMTSGGSGGWLVCGRLGGG